MLATLDRGDVRVVAERSEAQREPFEIVVGHLLVGEAEYVMLQPCQSDRRHGAVVERRREVDAGDDGSTDLTGRFDMQAHVTTRYCHRYRCADGDHR